MFDDIFFKIESKSFSEDIAIYRQLLKTVNPIIERFAETLVAYGIERDKVFDDIRVSHQFNEQEFWLHHIINYDILTKTISDKHRFSFIISGNLIPFLNPDKDSEMKIQCHIKCWYCKNKEAPIGVFESVALENVNQNTFSEILRKVLNK